MMGWMDLILLGAGTGFGVIGGWAMGQYQNRLAHDKLSAPDSSIASPLSQSTDVEDLDRTEIKTQIETLKQHLYQTQLAYQSAKEAAQFQAGFLARTAHELRSPINSAISLHQLILSDLCEDPAEEREFVAQAHTAVQKMLTILDQLIKVSKAIYSNEGFKLQPVSLGEILLEVYQFTYLQAQNRNLRLNIEFPDPDLEVRVDRNWFCQVLVSLIDAPLRLMEDGTMQVTTHLDPASHQVYIWIEDERPAHFWQDSIDLLQQLQAHATHPEQSLEAEAHSLVPSPQLMMLVNQGILQQMGGGLDILATPGSEDSSSLTRIQCRIPIASP